MDINQLHELADKLARATGPDSGIDDEMLVIFHGFSIDHDGWLRNSAGWVHDRNPSTAYTTSVDSALRLVAWQLPDWRIERIEQFEGFWRVALEQRERRPGETDETEPVVCHAATLPMAILRATVAALIAKHTHDASQDLDDDQDLGTSGPRM